MQLFLLLKLIQARVLYNLIGFLFSNYFGICICAEKFGV